MRCVWPNMASTSSSTFRRPCFVQWVLRRGNHSVSVCPVLIGLSPSICRQGGDGLCVAAMATDRVNERERAETMTLVRPSESRAMPLHIHTLCIFSSSFKSFDMYHANNMVSFEIPCKYHNMNIF